MKDIVKKIDIIYDPTNIYSEKDNMDVNSLFSISGKQKRDIELMPWLYRIFINREKLLDYDINMLDIKTKFIQYWMNKYGDLTNLNKKIKDYIIKVLHCCIITNFNNSEVPIVHIRFEFNNIDNKTLIEFQDIIINKFNLKGDELIRKLDSIEYDSNLSFDNENAELEVKKEYVIYAAGINYNKIRNIPYIDQNKTFCNDIDTIYRLYGIETARAALVREIQSVFSNGGSNINYHHLAIVTDLMTNTGVITSIDRHGVNKLETDPLSRSSFEKTIEILVNAAIFNETDHMKSVSSRIMAGKVFRGGTGLCDILLDNEILENSEFNEYKVIKDETDFIKLTSNNLIDDILKRENIDDLYVPNF
jgi:DNA-directed RNA polymerase II subunit RPB1